MPRTPESFHVIGRGFLLDPPDKPIISFRAAKKKRAAYQTRQGERRTIGCPRLQLKAFWNSGMFWTTPFTRYFGSECGFVRACRRAASSVAFSHQLCE
jgi:hypothetical protein